MKDREFVLSQHPDAYVRTWGSCSYVVRPRTSADKPAKIVYVSLSRAHSAESEAWAEAAEILRGSEIGRKA